MQREVTPFCVTYEGN